MGCSSSAAADVPSSAAAKEARKEETKDKLGEWITGANSKYKLGDKIGKGSYAQVHFAVKRHTNDAVAVKIRNLHPETKGKSQLDEDKVLKSSMHELALWKAVGVHDNIVQLLDSFFDAHLAYMVMEKCDSSLFKFLWRQEFVYETCLGKAFEHMLAGISHMHSVSVIHRDLKPDNFLIQGDTVKICDFGLSAMIPKSGIVEGVVGTAPYMPPEMLATEIYDEKADVWSFGVVAYMLLVGEFPYKTCDGSSRMMKKSILNGVEADCAKVWLRPNAIAFLQQLLKRRPCKRPTAASALELPFITNPESQPLPCLHKVLWNAHKTGAFDSKELMSETETDILLKKLKNGELEHKPIKNLANGLSTPPLKDVKSKIPKKMDEVLHDSPSPRSQSTQRSESTACGSSFYSSAASKGSFDSRRGKLELKLER